MALSFLQAAADTTDTNAYTFAAQNLGTATSDRYIIVSAIARKAGASTTLSSVTIGGVSATIIVQNTNTITNTDVAALVIAAVPSGATGDIVVTWGATMVRCAIGVWRVTELASPTASDSDSSLANDPTVNLDSPVNGFIIGAGITAASTSATWTNLTEVFDAAVEALVTYTGASDTFTDAQSGRAITIDFATSTESVGVFASWQFSQVTTLGTPGNYPRYVAVGNGMSRSEGAT